jgi:hypothetical protein
MGENLWVNPGLLQIEQDVNLTSSLSSFLDQADKEGVGNLTYHMNLTAGRAGVAKVTGLIVKYKIPVPVTGQNNKDFSPQGAGIMLVMLGLLIIVAMAVSSSKAPAQEPQVTIKAKGKKKEKEDVHPEPGPVIVRKPKVQVKAEKEEWDKPKKDQGKPDKKAGPLKEVKPAGIKVEVQKGGWKPSKSTVDRSKFEKAAEMRDEIKKDKKYKKNGK